MGKVAVIGGAKAKLSLMELTLTAGLSSRWSLTLHA